MLSGKNKQRFEEWFKIKFPNWSLDAFYQLELEFQKGVYEKYFDSLGYEFEKNRYFDDELNVTNIYEVSVHDYTLETSCLIHVFNIEELEAFTEAVKQLDKLINEEL
jgi:hypothetical protein